MPQIYSIKVEYASEYMFKMSFNVLHDSKSHKALTQNLDGNFEKFLQWKNVTFHLHWFQLISSDQFLSLP